MHVKRCGALGHKEKRCLLPLQPQNFAPKLPMVDIVNLLQSSRSPTTRQPHEISEKSVATLPSEGAFACLITHSHEVDTTPCSQIDNTLSLLAADEAAPTQSLIMEDIPSSSIILEGFQASEIEQPVDPRSPLTLDHHRFHMEPETPLAYGKGTGFDVVGDSSSYAITRGGRTVKPTQKIQDMGWTKISGKGKQGRRNRGNYNH